MKFEKRKCSLEEQQAIIEEFAARLKDVAYIASEERAKQAFDQLPDLINETDFITVNWQVSIVGMDLLQILGRLKRG